MFPYRVKYTESESDIQNYNLFYNNTKNAKILSKMWKTIRTFEKIYIKKVIVLFCNMYKFHNSYFVIFGNFENLFFYLFIYYTCRSLTRVYI